MSSSTEEDKKKMLITSKNEKNKNMLSVSRKSCSHACVGACLFTHVYVSGGKMRIIEENMDFEGKEHEKEGILITN